MKLLSLLELQLLTIVCCRNILPSSSYAISSLIPLSFVAQLGDPNKATFRCTVHNASYSTWEINGRFDTVMKRAERESRGIETNEDPIANMSSGSFFATLKLSANEVNQYTEIRCWAVVRNGLGRSVASETAIFQVQGRLGKPQNVSITLLNATHTLLQWLPPFTLNITDMEPDIFGYTVCVSISTLTNNCFNRTAPELLLPNVNTQKEVVISAWNGVGEGVPKQIQVDICGNLSIHQLKVPETVLQIEEDEQVNLMIVFDISMEANNTPICFCAYNVTLLTHNETLTRVGPLIPNNFHPNGYSIFIHHNITSGILPDEEYTAILTCTRSDTGNTALHFNSFDVQSVDLDIDHENLTLLICCKFALGSQARGCHVRIFGNQSEQPLISRNSTQSDGVSCSIDNLDPGTYLISVYDWERDDSIDLNKPVYSGHAIVNTSDGNNSINIISTISSVAGYTTMETQNYNASNLFLISVLGSTSAGIIATAVTVSVIACCACVMMKRKKKANSKDNVSLDLHIGSPIYEEILQPYAWEHKKLHNTEDELTTGLAMDTNVAYECPQERNKAYSMIEPKKHPLPTETPITDKEQQNIAPIYETV